MTPTLFVHAVTVLLYMAAGAFREVLVVQYYKSVGKDKKYSASGLAGAIELYDLLVLATVIQSGWNPVLLAVYVTGVMVGTFLGMSKK
jgi:hypothetical protein